MKSVLVFLLLILTLSCSSEEKLKKPENLIPKDKMVDILYEVLVINTAKGTSRTTLENRGLHPEHYIFNKYKIDSLQFALSNEYYSFHLEEYESIMTRVNKKFKDDEEKFKSKLDDEILSKQHKKDSIRALSESLQINLN